ncbi:hypothetical protein C1751_01555 [Pseudomonas fluorescens]|nr:hypothetical protein C1751_01555 [Pseudomonas fluorescens]
MFSCSKSEQKQLNTWVSFQSAEQPLLGQFSVSGNNANGSTSITPLNDGPSDARRYRYRRPAPVFDFSIFISVFSFHIDSYG